MGHLYPGMLDVSTDLTLLPVTFGSHVEVLEFDDLRQQPVPVQPHLPIMIGGSGEKKTLRTVAKYADLWNAMGPVDVMAHKVEVLRGHCDAVGRDIGEIEFTPLSETVQAAVDYYRDFGVHGEYTHLSHEKK